MARVRRELIAFNNGCWRVLVFMLVAFSSPTLVSAQDTRSPAAMLERILADLKEARAMVQVSPDARVRERVDLLLARAELAARDLQAGSGQTATRSAALSDQEFATFMTSLSSQTFDSGRLPIVKSLGKARITAAQGKQILQKFAFDKDKQEAAVFLHPLLVDPHLFAHVLEAMTFETSRAAVLKRVVR
jgi:hypothetical protein